MQPKYKIFVIDDQGKVTSTISMTSEDLKKHNLTKNSKIRSNDPNFFLAGIQTACRRIYTDAFK